jgi:HlyD family secretion protein
MKRTLIALAILLPITLIAGAGYLGYQNARATAEPPPAAPVTVVVTRGDVQQTVTAPGQLVGTHETILGMDVSGRLLQVNVRPGTVVKAGDVLARLDPKPFERALARAEIKLARTEAAYEQQVAEAKLATQNSEALVGSTQAQFPSLTAAEVNLQAAIDAQARAESEYDKALNRTWEPPEVADAYRLELERVKGRRQIAQAEYDAVLSQRWAVGQQVAAQQTEVERARLTAESLEESGIDPERHLAVIQANEDLAASILTAPFDGVVIDVFARQGAFISAGTDLVLLADPTQAEVRTTVIEEDVSLLEIGQRAELFLDARPDVAIQGTVARIVPQRVAGEARPLYHVYIQGEESLPDAVFPGMTVDASIIIDQETGALRLPRSLVQARSDGTAVVELWRNNRRVSKEIDVGLRGDVYVTVLEGLQEGDQVIGE